MTVKTALKGSVSLALLGVALQAQAATILMNFDGVTPNASVDQFRNGGTDSLGAPGVNYRGDFLNFSVTNGASRGWGLVGLAVRRQRASVGPPAPEEIRSQLGWHAAGWAAAVQRYTSTGIVAWANTRCV